MLCCLYSPLAAPLLPPASHLATLRSSSRPETGHALRIRSRSSMVNYERVLSVIAKLIQRAKQFNQWRRDRGDAANKTETKPYSIASGGVRYYSSKSAQKPIWFPVAAVFRRHQLDRAGGGGEAARAIHHTLGQVGHISRCAPLYHSLGTSWFQARVIDSWGRPARPSGGDKMSLMFLRRMSPAIGEAMEAAGSDYKTSLQAVPCSDGMAARAR